MVSWIFGGSVAFALLGAATVVVRFSRIVAEADLFDEFADREV